ncbi:MAG: GntR family transcriptional regulator [Pseudorhodobacter sp.]
MPQPSTRSLSTAPRFRQIVDALRQAITDGTLGAHAALPSERVVAEQHGVSRMTARRALEAMEAEGLAYNEQRIGRFVSPPRLQYDISKMVSFVADAQSDGTELEIEVISKGETKAGPQLAQALCVPVGEPLFEYTRLFRIQGHATFIETEYVLAARFPDLLTHDLCQSTTRLLERHYAAAAKSGDIMIRMRATKPEEAKLLGLAPHHAGIELEQVIRDALGTPFCFDRQVWRGELAVFTATAVVNG